MHAPASGLTHGDRRLGAAMIGTGVDLDRYVAYRAHFPWAGSAHGGQRHRVANSRFLVRFAPDYATRAAVTLAICRDRRQEPSWPRTRGVACQPGSGFPHPDARQAAGDHPVHPLQGWPMCVIQAKHLQSILI
ncbi:hypothetical protein FRACA_100066 [Frankia canadensis]|uniref:Uncharacterized protein n=1 Tax=Frankia canadensis TaxID=1836972 RepID=A0A2I2KIK5_9ACTN|nr:hypothetical protein FRACA_100066 [Frankia canadensis]SOU52787.1 hypothetical protein FRACA_100066 [Frankia canadensis]